MLKRDEAVAAAEATGHMSSSNWRQQQQQQHDFLPAILIKTQPEIAALNPIQPSGSSSSRVPSFIPTVLIKTQPDEIAAINPTKP